MSILNLSIPQLPEDQMEEYHQILDLFQFVKNNVSNTKLVENHPELISLCEQFGDYCIKNYKEVMQIMNTPDEEEDWDSVDTSNTHEAETDWECLEEEDEAEREWECLETNSIEEDEQRLEKNEKEKRERRLQKEKYVNGLWRQSQEDQDAAEFLKENNFYAQSIFWYQQANEKGLKALLLQNDIEYGTLSYYFKSHDIVFLAETLVKYTGMEIFNSELLSHARLMEAIGQKEQKKRTLCVRARYATTNMSMENTQPWFVFQRGDAHMAAETTKQILNYCFQELGCKDFRNSPSECIIQ